MKRRHALAGVVVAAFLGVGGGVALGALHGSHSAPRLPELHGQAMWKAGARPAPQAGLPNLRGHTSIVTFMDPLCTSVCPVEGRRLASVLRRVPATSRPTVVLVSVNPEATPADAARANRRWRLAPFATRWVLGTTAQLRRIWASYDVAVRPEQGDIVHTLVLYLVDSSGNERTAYLFPFAPVFFQSDLERLARERA